jgi:hypothetical protein
MVPELTEFITSQNLGRTILRSHNGPVSEFFKRNC